MLSETRDTKAGLEKRLTQARYAMESMTLPRTRDDGASVPGGDGADLEGRLRATDEVWTAKEARLRERERDSKLKGLLYNLATANERGHGEGRGDHRRALGGARGPHAAANDLD